MRWRRETIEVATHETVWFYTIQQSGFGNRFRSDGIVLVRLHVGLPRLHGISRRSLAQLAQSAAQKVRSPARFHAEQLHLQVRGEVQQLRAGKALT